MGRPRVTVDTDFVWQLMEEEGMSYGDAIRVAATEMAGVPEGSEDGVNGSQTYCDDIAPEGGWLEPIFRGRRR
jgi:hypothetical protein